MHPYTVALLSAVPVPDTKRRAERERIRLQGDVPGPINPPPACRFHTRCWKAQEICKTKEPPLLRAGPRGHRVACHFRIELAAITPVIARPMERVNFTGTYKGADNITSWRSSASRPASGRDFGVQATVRVGTFDTYIMTGRSGEYRFRVYDPEADESSNVILVTID